SETIPRRRRPIVRSAPAPRTTRSTSWVRANLTSSHARSPSVTNRSTGRLDLNRRPLGYEGKSNPHRNQDEPTQTNDDEALLNGSVGLFWLISVGLLHSTFIASRGGRRVARSTPAASIQSRSERSSQAAIGL